jgi:N-acetylglucosamine kinase-like BadF-type ATPase
LKILIADSGSTKCDWLCIDEAGNVLTEFHTMGFNPYFHNADLVEEKMLAAPKAAELAGEIDLVYFYGAGSSSESLCSIIREGLERVFNQAKVHVGHDLEGAAFSTYAGEPAITCIIGTGSNSCFFDGENVSEEVPALAYILGDEASGSWFGKRLIATHLYKKLDPVIEEDFVNTFGFTKDDLVNRVYKEPNANVFLASFMTFLGRHQDKTQVISWLEEGFQAFVDVHIKCFANYRDVQVNFVGSVAYHFQDVLRHVCDREDIRVGSITKRPIDGLAQYHVEHIIPGVEQA